MLDTSKVVLMFAILIASSLSLTYAMFKMFEALDNRKKHKCYNTVQKAHKAVVKNLAIIKENTSEELYLSIVRDLVGEYAEDLIERNRRLELTIKQVWRSKHLVRERNNELAREVWELKNKLKEKVEAVKL